MKIFLDLDGVLVDWSGGVCKLLDIDPYEKEAQELLRKDTFLEGWKFGTAEEIDIKVNAAGYQFWMNLELTPWAHDLIALCRKYPKEGKDNLYFLTSPGKFHAGAHAKLDYIRKHFDSDQYILTKHKYVCARSLDSDRHLLIDDMRKNIDEWTKAGGTGFHWPCQWRLREEPELLRSAFDNLEAILKHNE